MAHKAFTTFAWSMIDQGNSLILPNYYYSIFTLLKRITRVIPTISINYCIIEVPTKIFSNSLNNTYIFPIFIRYTMCLKSLETLLYYCVYIIITTKSNNRQYCYSFILCKIINSLINYIILIFINPN